MIIFLAFRNLYRQRERYALIAVAVTVGFALITIITGIAYGALETVKDKAARYFAGHISISGYLPGGQPSITDPLAIIEMLTSRPLPIRTISKRSVYSGATTIFFGGETIRQRRLVGINFASEGKEFSGLSFSSGGWEAMNGDEGKNGILVSAAAARILQCRVGDDLTLYVTTDTGQYNTASLIVHGIFRETSLFGYVAYMRIDDLNHVLRRPPGAATDIAIYAESGTDTIRLAREIRSLLAKEFPVFPFLANREARDSELAKGIFVETLAVLSLNAQLAEITQFLDALLAVTYFVLISFLAIVMVGILNTYRVLVHERTREIGAMRALGMHRSTVQAMFLMEASVLALIASTAGLLLGALLLRLIVILDLSALPAAGMFLDGGRLRFFLEKRIVLINMTLMTSAVLLAAFGPARRAGNIRPADAMRSAS